jgi:hypothetical protein
MISALPAAEPDPDAAIYQKIERLRHAAAQLRLDGNDRDWAEFPQFADPRGDAGADSRRDILAAAIAPTDTDLWVMIRTAGPPTSDPWGFYVRVDMFGDRQTDFRIEYKSPDEVFLRLADQPEKPGEPVRLSEARVAVRRVVEMRIPYKDIEAALEKADARLGDCPDFRGHHAQHGRENGTVPLSAEGDSPVSAETKTETVPAPVFSISGAKARPWVRIFCTAWDWQKRRIADEGPTAASFRLATTPYPLDAALPERPRPPVAVAMPVRGQWFLWQGPFGSYSHRGDWAYDLVILDAVGSQWSAGEGKKNADYHAWGKPVLAPIEGRVFRAESVVEDSTPRTSRGKRDEVNEVHIAGGTFGMNLVHLQHGSATVKAGDRVTAGQQVACVGNSGLSDMPHLHFIAWGGPRQRATTPVVLRNVRVGLNPGKNDPWARDLPQWEPRQGYFVEGKGEGGGRKGEGGRMRDEG